MNPLFSLLMPELLPGKMSANCGAHESTRRRFLFGSALTAASCGLLTTSPAEAEETSGRNVTPRGSAKTCVFINLSGAPSQLDTFDPKDGPWNPPDLDLRDYSGGIRLSRKVFPQLSALTNELCVLRVQASEAAHERGQFVVQTGHTFSPASAPEIPHLGAVIAKEKAGNGRLPPFLGLNTSPLRGPAFLGGQYTPFAAQGGRTGIGILQHDHYGAESQKVFETKFSLLSRLDAGLRRAPYNQAMADYARMYDQAKGAMYDEAVAGVFKWNVEDETRYGRSGLGNALIVARNAIRARNDVVFMAAEQGGWDQHFSMWAPGNRDNYYRLGNTLDTALANFVIDLRNSGDLASTLIVVMGEFGRTPGVLNTRDGRDHHKDAMGALLIGGGVRGGRALGKTDENGALIVDSGWAHKQAISPEDVVATMYSALGIDWTKRIKDTPTGKIYEYLEGADRDEARPVNEVFG